MESAGSKVFHTVELLEEILMNFEINNLFRLQRTSTTFRNVLQSSRFKRKMFLSTSSPTVKVSHQLRSPLVVLALLKVPRTSLDNTQCKVSTPANTADISFAQDDDNSELNINPFLESSMFAMPEYDIKFHSSRIEHECRQCSPSKKHLSMSSNKHELIPSKDRACCHEALSIWCTIRINDPEGPSSNESPLPLESWKHMRLAKSLPTDVEVTFNVYDPASSTSWPTFGSSVRLLPGQNSFQQLLDLVEKEMTKGGCRPTSNKTEVAESESC